MEVTLGEETSDFQSRRIEDLGLGEFACRSLGFCKSIYFTSSWIWVLSVLFRLVDGMRRIRISKRRMVIVGALAAAAAVVFLRPSRDVGSSAVQAEAATPVLLVHGMFSSGKDMADMRAYLEARGFSPVVALDLSANDGSVGIADLSQEVATAVDRLRKETGKSRIDLVGYSMGAMVSRYFLQRRGGKEQVRRFVSIAGPHHGVVAGLLSHRPGARDMRPESALVQDLESDKEPFGSVEVFDFWFPLDPVIVPSFSAILRGSKLSCPFLVKSHGDMIHDEKTHAAIAEVLQTGTLVAKDGCTDKEKGLVLPSGKH